MQSQPLDDTQRMRPAKKTPVQDSMLWCVKTHIPDCFKG